MTRNALTIGAALLALAGPVAAQQRGTVELGAFASAGMFDNSLTLDKGFGAGGHVGIFLDPRVALEFEKGEMRATRTLGRNDVNVGILNARLVGTALQSGNLSILLCAGAGASTETNFLHSYGVNGMVGAKWAFSNTVALRADLIADFLANNDWKSYQSLHVGLSFFRHPNEVTKTVTVTVTAPAAAYVQRPDSVSAEEQARLRRRAEEYRELRDSLNRRPVMPPSSAEALATMQQMIHFATDKSEITPEAKAILDAKVLVFRANPSMRIIIDGNTDERASDRYNMALGGRRADAAKAYLVSQGIDASRIEITSDGERKPIAAGTSRDAQGQNRRDEFRLLIGSDYLVKP